MNILSKALLSFTSTDKERLIVETRLDSTSNRQAARKLSGVSRRTVDRTIKRIAKRAEEAGASPTLEDAKLLFLDIETAPMLGYLWNLWPRNGVNPQMQEERTYVMSWAAKWAGSPKDSVMSGCLFDLGPVWASSENDMPMLESIWSLLDEADFVVAHNGDNFDVKYLNTEFVLAGMRPPSPYRQIDTLKMVRRCFKFDSNKLSYLVPLVLRRPAAKPADGFDTWRRCLAGDESAWEELLAYNRQDVLDLEDIYLKIRSWDKNHPSIATPTPKHAEAAPTCPTCGSEEIRPTGKFVTTNVSRFEHFVCDGCGANLRGRQSLVNPTERSMLLMRAK